MEGPSVTRTARLTAIVAFAAIVLTGFVLMGPITVGGYWIFSPGSYSSQRLGAAVTLKQPLLICRSADSVRRKGESGHEADDDALPRMLFHECREVEVGTELTVEEVGTAVTRVRAKDAIASAYASTDQLMANGPAVDSK